MAGEFTISTGGGSGNSSQAAGEPGNTFGQWGQGQDTAGAATTTDSTSAKGLKAAGGVFVAGGTFDFDTSDDSVHSNGNVTIDGGTLNIASGDDGIHADGTLEINGGEIAITQSYEGLESAVMTINDGTIHMVTSDDGINVAGGADSSSVSGRPGQNDFAVNENNQLYINGGYIAIDANGDALDCNGRIFMTDGVVILNGPTNDGNGAIDYMGEFTVSGGLLVAAGSSGMAEAPSETSSQNSIMVNLDQMQQAGTLVHIVSEDGDEILTMAPTKQYQSVVVELAGYRAGRHLQGLPGRQLHRHAHRLPLLGRDLHSRYGDGQPGHRRRPDDLGHGRDAGRHAGRRHAAWRRDVRRRYAARPPLETRTGGHEASARSLGEVQSRPFAPPVCRAGRDRRGARPAGPHPGGMLRAGGGGDQRKRRRALVDDRAE